LHVGAILEIIEAEEIARKLETKSEKQQ